MPISVNNQEKDGSVVDEEDVGSVQMQVFVSEHMLNSAALAAHQAGKIVLPYKASSTYMKTFFSNFEEVYGHHEQMKLVLQSESPPKIKISDGLSTFECNGRIRILNPFAD